MSDERYERSADMRLLELRREALGVPRRTAGSTSYTDPELLNVSTKDDEPYVQTGTILMATTDARPRIGLIAGALVSVTLSIVNEGDTAAHGVRMSLPLPAQTSYRAGTLAIDGIARNDEIANEIFAQGADLGDVEPRARRNVTLKLLIEAGNEHIVLLPHLVADSGAILGLRAIRLMRKVAAARPAIVDRPFYESDESEHEREPLTRRTPPARIAVLQPREVPPSPSRTAISKPAKPVAEKTPAPRVAAEMPPALLLDPPTASISVAAKIQTASTKRESAIKPPSKPETKREVKPRVKSKPKASAPAGDAVANGPRPKIEVVRSIDDRVSFSGQGGPILAVRIDRRRLATLAALFNGPSLGMVAHYLVLNALAVREPLPGDGNDDSIAAFVASQEQLLTRALIATRLGKLPSPENVGAALPAFPPALTAHAERRTIDTPPIGEAMLFRAFAPSEVAFVKRMLSNDAAAPFLRAAQLFVGLCANDALIANESERFAVGVALTAYAALATGEISRIFLRAKLHRVPELFRATDASFDDAARTVLAALNRSMT